MSEQAPLFFERRLGGCIVWNGARSKAGYGQRTINGKVEYVHRLAAQERCRNERQRLWRRSRKVGL